MKLEIHQNTQGGVSGEIKEERKFLGEYHKEKKKKKKKVVKLTN